MMARVEKKTYWNLKSFAALKGISISEAVKNLLDQLTRKI